MGVCGWYSLLTPKNSLLVHGAMGFALCRQVTEELLTRIADLEGQVSVHCTC